MLFFNRPRLRHGFYLALAAVALGYSALFLPARAEGRDLPASFADLVDKLSPAVVNVSTTQKVKGGGVQFFGLPLDQMPDDPQLEPFRDFMERFGQKPGKPGKKEELPEHEVTSLGSGFIIDATGFIISNEHVIDDAEEITVTLSDNSKYKAKIIGRDKKSDLALLKIDAKKPLPYLTLGDSDKMRVGDWVIAIGNPYGLGGSVTHGIISARQRSINAGPYDEFLQTDAPINRGNSGGPLFNMNGEVIGINTAIFSPSGGNIGIGFAVPVDIAKPVIDQLKQYGRTHRSWLGVKIQEVSDEIAESVGLAAPKGALVAEISKGSPAEKAGIEVGDIITSFDGREITEMRFLPRIVAETKIGKDVEIGLWRKGKSLTVHAVMQELDEKDEEQAEEGKPAKPKGNLQSQTVLGVQLSPLTSQLRKDYQLEEKLSGLLIVDVKQGSEAARRGLSEGDVIVEAGNEPVASVEDLRKQVELTRKSARKFILLKVKHEKETAFITLPVEEKR
ncbi:MAG: DegQ family serine endoprotease [Alphaproteobacteria bacterium]|nr:DegQ family serine endoprotease [Alphaproteobacteria bacterium]